MVLPAIGHDRNESGDTLNIRYPGSFSSHTLVFSLSRDYAFERGIIVQDGSEYPTCLE